MEWHQRSSRAILLLHRARKLPFRRELELQPFVSLRFHALLFLGSPHPDLSNRQDQNRALVHERLPDLREVEQEQLRGALELLAPERIARLGRQLLLRHRHPRRPPSKAIPPRRQHSPSLLQSSAIGRDFEDGAESQYPLRYSVGRREPVSWTQRVHARFVLFQPNLV